MFENELNKVYEVIDEKDCTIASLKPFLQKTQESLENSLLEKELKRINVLDKAEAPILTFKSPFCDYQARSSNGLKSHIRENLSSYKSEICGNE